MKTRTALYIDPATLAAVDARVDGIHVPSRNAFIVRAIDRALNVRVIDLPLAAWGHNGAQGIHLNVSTADAMARVRMIATAREDAAAQGLDTVFTYN